MERLFSLNRNNLFYKTVSKLWLGYALKSHQLFSFPTTQMAPRYGPVLLIFVPLIFVYTWRSSFSTWILSCCNESCYEALRLLKLPTEFLQALTNLHGSSLMYQYTLSASKGASFELLSLITSLLQVRTKLQ